MHRSHFSLVPQLNFIGSGHVLKVHLDPVVSRGYARMEPYGAFSMEPWDLIGVLGIHVAKQIF